MIDLPYEKDFDEKERPTKARSIQMNSKLEQHCRKKISDLESKGIISKSRSPWSCVTFHVNTNAKIERGAPRLVIKYKTLKKC